MNMQYLEIIIESIFISIAAIGTIGLIIVSYKEYNKNKQQ